LYRNDCTNRAAIWHGAFIHQSHAVLWRNSGVSPKIRALPSGILSQTSDFENFAAPSRSHCRQLVVVDVRWRHLYTTIDESWLFTTSPPTVTPKLYSICCIFVVQHVSTVDEILTDSASRCPSAVAKFLVVRLVVISSRSSPVSPAVVTSSEQKLALALINYEYLDRSTHCSHIVSKQVAIHPVQTL